MSNFDNSNSNGGGGGGTISSKTLVENSALREAENEDIRNQIAKVQYKKYMRTNKFEFSRSGFLVGKRNSGNFNKISVVLLPHPDITYVQKTFFQMNYNPLGDHVFKYESNCFATREQLKKVCLESRYCLDGSNIKTAIDEMCLGTAPG